MINFKDIFNGSDRYLFLWLVILLIWLPLPLGSNRIWSEMLLASWTYLLAIAWLVLFLRHKVIISRAYRRARFPFYCLLLIQCWVFVQQLVLPESLICSINAFSCELYSHLPTTIDADFSVSVARHKSFMAMLSGLSFSLLFALGLLLVNSRARFYCLIAALLVSGVFQASYGVIMALSDWHYLFFVEKWTMFNMATGTFVNRNHLAGYLGICLAFGVGLLIDQLQQQKNKHWREHMRDFLLLLLSYKVLLRLGIILMVVALIMTYSRMGNMAFFIALTAAGALYFWSKKKLSLLPVLFFLSIILIDILVISQWFGLERLVQRIENTEITEEKRYTLNMSLWDAFAAQSVVGGGADTTDVTLPIYMQSHAQLPFEHIHNDYIELWLNYGAIGMLFFGLFILSLLKQLRIRYLSRRMPYMYVMLLAYVSVHSLTDFNLHIPAFAASLCLCLSLLFVRRSDFHSSHSHQ